MLFIFPFMKIRFFLPFGLFILSLTVMPAGIAAQTKKPPIKPITATVTVLGSSDSASKLTPAQQRRHDAFYLAWSTLNRFYFDKTFGGLDWEKIRVEYLPRVNGAKTDLEFHHILKEMLDRLGKSHLNVIIPEYFEQLEYSKKQARIRGKQLAAEKRVATAGGNVDEPDDDLNLDVPEDARFGIGVEVRMLADRIVITHVDSQSGATIAGLKPGFVIDKINGVALNDIVAKALINGNSAQDLRYLLPFEIVESFLNGPQDTSVYLTCLDEKDAVREFTVPRLRLDGAAISISKNLPEQFLRYESRSLSPDVGYIKFNVFAMPVVGKFCDSLTDFKDKKGIVIDLRGNPGGIIGSMIGLSGMLTDQPITLGTFRSRAGSEPFIVPAKTKHFNGRIVLLVNSESMSAAEMFAAGLKESGRAIVVGEKTGGKSLPAVWIKLPTGAVMMYPMADFITVKGTSLEGIGLEPDRAIALDRKSLLQGEDMQLKAALAVTGDDKAFAKSQETKHEDRLTMISGLSTAESPPPPPMRVVPKMAPTPLATPGPSDARSIKIIADFAAAAGGLDALNRIVSYDAKGNMTSGPNGDVESEMFAARQFPDKFVMVLNSPSLGEIREIYNGKSSLLQSDYGVDRNMYPGLDTTRVQLFSPIFDVLDPDYLKGIKYEGEYEVEGHKRQVLTATGPKGVSIGLSFDSTTKMLISYSAPGLLYQLEDYRKIDGIMIPFHVDLDRVMNVRLTSVTINPKLDPSNFEKKEKCFDKAN